MKLLCVLLSILFFCACSPNRVEKSAGESAEESEQTNRDSLGYPSWYTPPELEDINQLKAILDSADEVIAYNFNVLSGPDDIEGYNDLYKWPDGTLSDRFSVNKTILTADQIKKVISITCDTSTYDGRWTGLAGSCFIPHHGFGFFKNEKLVAEVSVCFTCSGIRTRPYYKSDGLSRKGFKKYDVFAKSIGLEDDFTRYRYGVR